MEQEQYKMIKDAVFSSYKSFVDYINLTSDQRSMYCILVVKSPLSNGLVNVNIVIRNSYNHDNLLNEYASNTVLSKDIANELINDIRDDFKDNHYIMYSSVNYQTFIHTLQNTMFSLNIKLINEKEYNEAMEYNHLINSKDRKMVLTRI